MSIILRILEPDGSERIEEVEPPAKAGRAPDCEILLHDPSVSRYHLSIEFIKNSFFVRDLGSRNGTFLNGKEITISSLSCGDIITAGNTQIEVKELKREISKDERFSISSLSRAVHMIANGKIDEAIQLLTGCKGYVIQIKGDFPFTHSSGMNEDEVQKALKALERVFSLPERYLEGESGVVVKIGGENMRGGIYLSSPEIKHEDYEMLSEVFSIIPLRKTFEILKEKNLAEEKFRLMVEKFLPTELIEGIKSGVIAFEPSLRNLTVLFCDMVSFTSLCEKLQPKEITGLLIGYYEIVADAVKEHGGSINKFLGDGIMAVFGLPETSVNHEIKGVKSALIIRKRLSQLRIPLEGIKVRIGVNTGTCVVGGMGSRERMEYTVIGDTVNITARLQEMASPGQILIGENTWNSVKEQFNTKYVGTISLRGKRAKTRIYEIIEP